MSANISYKALLELHELYLNGKNKILSGQIGKEDTRTIWFELNEPMKQFLTDVLNKDGITGIKMYFLQNPDKQIDIDGDGKLTPANELDINQLSVGLVATKKTDSLSRGDSASSFGEEDFEVPPINHGTLCPQICG